MIISKLYLIAQLIYIEQNVKEKKRRLFNDIW